MDTVLQRAIEAAGGPAAVGRLYDPPISSQAVSQWAKCPPSRVKALAAASGIAAHELRPDLYDPPAAGPAPGTRPQPQAFARAAE